MRKILILSFYLFIFFTYAYADCPAVMPEGMVYCEDFDDRYLNDSGVEIRSSVATNIYPPAYQFASPGRDGTGYHLAAGTFHNPGVFKLVSSQWGSDELFVRYWCKFENWLYTTSHENIKMNYHHWDSDNSYASWIIASPGGFYYSARDRNRQMLEVGSWPSSPINFMDGNWHKWEWWVKFSSSEAKFWIDGILIDENDYYDGAWTNNIYYLWGPGQDSQSQGSWTRSTDDWEVWDRMPPTSEDIPSDLNLDGTVNITDAIICVNVILGSESNPDYIARAKAIAAPTDAANILDLMGIISEILNPSLS